jgi:hypothetical protein
MDISVTRRSALGDDGVFEVTQAACLRVTPIIG